MYDLMIIGSGPAGISAALTAKARNLNFIWFGSRALSTKIEKAEKIMNYPGLPAVTGSEMQSVFLKQIDDCGITITESQVNSIYDCGGYFAAGADNEIYEAKAVIMTVGMTTTREIEGEARLLGCGVSYCATCDGALYKNKDIAVICASPKFEDEVTFLAGLANHIYLFTPYKETTLQYDNIIRVYYYQDLIWLVDILLLTELRRLTLMVYMQQVTVQADLISMPRLLVKEMLLYTAYLTI